MATYEVLMTEVVTYKLVFDVEDNATEEEIEKLAEEEFVQGNYSAVGQSDREVIGVEKVG